MAQRSEDGVGKTRETSKRLERAKAVWTRSAISIQASGHVTGRIKQAGHTEAPEPARTNLSNTPLNPKGRPHTDIGTDGHLLVCSTSFILAGRGGRWQTGYALD